MSTEVAKKLFINPTSKNHNASQQNIPLESYTFYFSDIIIKI